MNKKLILGVLASCSLALTSCLGEGDKEGQITGYFTVNTSGGQTVLYMDGGATIYPTPSSVADLTDGKGLSGVERAMFSLTYPEEFFIQKENGYIEIREAKLTNGDVLPVFVPYTSTEAADAKNVTNTDSIQALNSLDQVWCYGGYFNVTSTTKYYIQDGKAVRPTLSCIMTQSEEDSRVININLLNNLHPLNDKKESIGGNAQLLNSFNISKIKDEFMLSGIDSVTFVVTSQSVNPITFKSSVKQFNKPF